MNQKLHSTLQMHPITTSKDHLAANSWNGNSGHAWHPLAINHKLEFQQQAHSARNIKTGQT